jgi:hypothetical protein
MSTVKCPHCGLVNFANAVECKRCKNGLDGSTFESPATPAQTLAGVESFENKTYTPAYPAAPFQEEKSGFFSIPGDERIPVIVRNER